MQIIPKMDYAHAGFGGRVRAGQVYAATPATNQPEPGAVFVDPCDGLSTELLLSPGEFYEVPEGYFVVPPERWDTALCRKTAKRRERDSYGTPAPWPGLLVHLKSGPVRYNGGVMRDGGWWKGVVFTLPTIPDAFAWEYVPTWGWRLVET